MSDEAKFKQVIEELAKARGEHGVAINGKLYSMVKDRVEVFRKAFGSAYGIDTHIDYSQGFTPGAVIVATAKITKDNITVASGHAMDRIGSDDVSWTACVEAAETAAIGRALACLGLHGGEYASDAEMTAIPRKQEAVRQTQAEHVTKLLNSGFFVPDEHEAVWNNPSEMARKVIDEIGRIADPNELGKYWEDLGPFLDYMGREARGLQSEIKAAFSTRYSEMRN